MKCVELVSYQVLINGSPNNIIKPTRRLRQGDPISPMLFLICMEGLSSRIRKLKCENKIEGIKIKRTSPTIMHLLFADDCYIFNKIRGKYEENIKNY